MGYLRTLFAITVAIGHGWPGNSFFVGGENAVQLFYMISGFLISYVLIEKRSYTSVGHFYVSRFLRIYPIYFVVGACALLFLLITDNNGFIEIYKNAPPLASAWLAISNFLLLGQDWILFVGVHDGALHFSQNFYTSDLPLYRGLIVPVAWSLGVELSFYLIAPWILKSKRVMVALFFVSILLRLYLKHIGIGGADPWTYRFFPTELALFLGGALSHQILLPFFRKYASSKAIIWSTILFIGISISYSEIPFEHQFKSVALLATFSIGLPLFFLFSSISRFDSIVGNLSYPIYICHLLILWFLERIMPVTTLLEKKIWSITGVFLSVLAAYALHKFIGEPIESIRARTRNIPSSVQGAVSIRI